MEKSLILMPSLKAVGGSESDSEMEQIRHGDGLSDLKEKLTNLNLRTGRFNKRSSINFSL